jgi:geranylgeranyl diphosphate synthase type II
MPALAVNGKLYLEEQRRFVDELLDKFLPPEDKEPQSLHKAMRYSVMAGGKRLRPILALAAYQYCGGQAESGSNGIHNAMAALELVHTYSLIHDDLPCMDDDDLRRGIPTCHKKFGEAAAVLAGDALHDIAFGLVAQTGSAQAVIELAEAIGTYGMGIHVRKTGALIRCSVRVGALLAGADDALMTRLTGFGEKIGLAFQIIDDILDVEGDPELLGKKTGSDSKKQKATYPRAVGMKQAHEDATRLIDEAIALFEPTDENMLKNIAIYIGQRRS